VKEQNPVWAPIVPKPRPLWGDVKEIIAAYQAAEPVRVNRSQRYGLAVVER
jgi:hypothetical protein